MKSKISKLSTVIALALSTASVSVQAEDYTTFTEVSYGDINDSYYQLGIQHYFNSISNKGPLDEFGYIVAESNIFASYFDTDGLSVYHLGGEAYLGQVLLGFERQNSDTDFGSFDLDTFALGYLINKDLLVRLNYISPEEGDSNTQFELRYNHQLEGDNYWGTDVTYLDEGNVLGLSSKYFAAIEGGRYFAFGFNMTSGSDISTQYGLEADYYFDTMTSLGASYAKGGDYGLNFKRFFNKNIALEVSYDNHKDADVDQWEISLLGSF